MFINLILFSLKKSTHREIDRTFSYEGDRLEWGRLFVPSPDCCVSEELCNQELLNLSPAPAMKKYVHFYRPPTKFAKVMFLHLFVSHSVHGGGGSASVHAGIEDPPGADTPRAVHAGKYGQQVGGTHPTGMHTCFYFDPVSTVEPLGFVYIGAKRHRFQIGS